jgi:hypothetical protein
MKKQRVLSYRKCPDCGHNFPEPRTVFRLPEDTGLLADAVELPGETVSALIDHGTIPTRRSINKNGRPYGPVVVLFHDALKAMKGLRENNS